MDSTDMKIFLTVARIGNVSTAASALYITQSALSKRIKNLEETLGVSLFIRGKGKKGVEITQAGMAFMELAQQWQGLWQDMRSLRGRNLQGFHSLNIGVLDSVQPLTVCLSHSLCRRSPTMRIRFHVRHSVEMYDEIDKRVIDAGFSLLERQMSSVRRKRLFSEPFVVLCAGKHPAARDGTLNLQDLDPDTELYTAWWSQGYLAWHVRYWELQRSQRLCTNSVLLQKAFLGTLGQWVIMPYSIAREASAEGPFTMYLLNPEPPPRVCHLLTHKQPRAGIADALEIFSECLNQALQEKMPWADLDR